MYVQYKKPNQEAMASLISNLRGERTLATYADDIKRSTPKIKVSASTLSRACNCGDNPVNYDLLEAIARISDEPEKVLAHLLEANGTRSQEDDKQLARKSELEKRRAMSLKFNRDVEMIIQNEIIGRGYQVRRLKQQDSGTLLVAYYRNPDKFFLRNYSFGYSVSGMYPCSTWKFLLCPIALSIESIKDSGAYSDSEGLSLDEARRRAKAHVGFFINRAGVIFASDCYEAELYESEKYSFVFNDEITYGVFLERLEDRGIRVNGLMTAILVDVEKGRVIDETQLKRYDGEKAYSLFRQPEIEDEDENIDEISDLFGIVEDEE